MLPLAPSVLPLKQPCDLCPSKKVPLNPKLRSRNALAGDIARLVRTVGAGAALTPAADG